MTVEELWKRLDEAVEADWEAIYAGAADVHLDPERVEGRLCSSPRWARWLGLRFDAGPPGVPLPDPVDALHRLLETRTATPLDAYAAVLTPRGALPDDVPPQVLLAILSNATLAAASTRKSWLSAWLGARAALAGLALGDADRAWGLFDEFSKEGAPHPQFATVAHFAPIRGHEALESSPWLKTLICRLWPRLEVPLIAALPFPEAIADAPAPLERFCAGLEQVGATKLLALVRAATEGMAADSASVPASDPLIETMERLALSPEPTAPPDVAVLPPWFETWAFQRARGGASPLARLAGLLLLRHRLGKQSHAAALVLPFATSADVRVLREVFAGDPAQELFDELGEAIEGLPTEVADAVVSASVPNHAWRGAGISVLVENLPLLESRERRPGRVIDGLVKAIRQIVDDRERETAAAMPAFTTIVRNVRAALERAGSVTRLDARQLESLVAGIDVPPLSLGVLELADETSLPEPERLVFCLALEKALSGTDFHEPWIGRFRELASDVLFRIGQPGLLAIRMRLLDALVERPGPGQSRARLHYQRANTRQALSEGAADALPLILADLRVAAEDARREGVLDIVADAEAALALAEFRHGKCTGERTAALHRLDAVLELPLSPLRRATVLRAQARMCAEDDLGRAVALLETALAGLPETDTFHWEITAELLGFLSSSGRPEEAVRRGESLLKCSTEQIDESDIALLHLAVADALQRCARGAKESALHAEAALKLYRGRELSKELQARLILAWAAISLGDLVQAAEHLRVLDDHRARLDDAVRATVGELHAKAAEERGDVGSARAVLHRALGEVSDDGRRLRLQLLQAELDPAGGPGSSASLEELIRKALEAGADGGTRAIAEELACRRFGQLPQALLESAAESAAAAGRAELAAEAFAKLGQPDRACSLLVEALRHESSRERRLGLVGTLITVLPLSDEEKRQEAARELESLLASVEGEHPRERINLAATLHHLANDDDATLERAWAHGLRARGHLKGPQAIEFADRLLAHILHDRLRGLYRASPVENTRIARWLMDEPSMETVGLAEIRLAAASVLLFGGALCPRETLETARQLVERAERTLGATRPVLAAADRCAWALARREGIAAAVVRGHDVVREPFDDAPEWLVALLAGRDATPTLPELEEALDILAVVLEWRGEGADQVLASLWPIGSGSEGFLERVERVIQQVRLSGAETRWDRLHQSSARESPVPAHPHVSTVRMALRRARGEPSTEPVDGSTNTLSPREAFREGVALMDAVRRNPHGPEASNQIRHARELLERAASSDHGTDPLERSAALTSLGNAWKTPPDEDLERALHCYDEAERLTTHPDEHAKIQKVRADALLQRGRPADLRIAKSLLERSISQRKGRLRSESCISLAHVLDVHPDMGPKDRIIEATMQLVEAVRAHRPIIDEIVKLIVRRLADWECAAPTDARPAAIRDELIAVAPLHEKLLRHGPRLSPDVVTRVVALGRHPSMVAFLRVAAPLHGPEVFDDQPELESATGPSARNAMREKAARDSLVGNAEGLRRHLDALDRASADAAEAPGIAAGRVEVLAALVRLGASSVERLRDATLAARDVLGRVEDRSVRATLLGQVARVWAPVNHLDLRVRDFALAVELGREVVALEGGDEAASFDSRHLLARTLRYLGGSALAEAQVHVERLLKRARKGPADELAAALVLAADLTSHAGDGDVRARRRAAVSLYEEAVEVADTPAKKNEYRAQLAWALTELAESEPPQDKRQVLHNALTAFDAVVRASLHPAVRAFFEGNRRTCEALLAQLSGSRDDSLHVFRQHLASLDENTDPAVRATAEHNVANVILTDLALRTTTEVEEALALCRKALAVRRTTGNPRHLWETPLLAGGAIAHELQVAELKARWRLSIPANEAFAQSRMWLKEAVSAARELGVGEELLRAALGLSSLALGTSSARLAEEVAEEGWSSVRSAGGVLLLSTEHREKEAQLAAHIAARLAFLHASTGLVGMVTGFKFALEGAAAESVMRWVGRAYGPRRRLLRARLARPTAVPIPRWLEWLEILRRNDPLGVSRQLNAIRERDPAFLSTDPDLEETWRWLEARPRAVAVAPVLTGCPFALVLRHDAEGHRRITILGLRDEAREPIPDLAHAMREAVDGSTDAVAQHESAARHVRTVLIEPLLRHLGRSPGAVLWIPPTEWRSIAPHALWGDVPVATASGLEIPSTGRTIVRPRGTLLVLADPGFEGNDRPEPLREHGRRSLESLAGAAQSLGPVRLVASVGDRWGRGLLGEGTHVRDTPADPRAIVEEAGERDVVVLIAHGEVLSPEEAAFVCVGEGGEIERLDIARLGSEAERFVGALVILLSCESARVGSALAEPGGLAGALISAGARAVVAPLWPVRLDVAREVAERVLHGLRNGRDPWNTEVRQDSAEGPFLGRSQSLGQQEANRALQRLAFVTWIG